MKWSTQKTTPCNVKSSSLKSMPKNRTQVSQASGGVPLKWSEKSPAGKLLKKIVKDGVIKEDMPPILQ